MAQKSLTSLDFDVLRQINRKPCLGRSFQSSPTFIIACRRSGTTLLSWLLDSHSNIAVVPENGLCSSLFDSSLESVGPRASVLQMMHTLATFGEEGHVFLGRIGSLIEGIYSDYAKANNKVRWIGKELFIASFLDVLDACFDYQAKYIFITRHGLDVAYSIARKFGYWNNESVCSGMPLMNGLEEWRKVNGDLTKFALRNRERVHTLKYEDMVNEPARIGAEVFKFLGEPWDETILQRMWHTDHHPNLGYSTRSEMGVAMDSLRSNQWTEWPSELLQQLGLMANETLSELGYAAIKIY